MNGEDSERALLARLRGSEEAAFEELVRANAARLLAVCRRILRSEEDARDAVQEAFLCAFQGLDRFAGDARLSTWLHRIAVNASLMKLRSRRCRPETPIEDLLPRFGPDGGHAPGAWESDALERLDACATRSRVRACIDQLPESYRTVLVLRDLEGLDTRETAAALGASVETVKIRLHRARQALRTLLVGHGAARAAA
jgi:RNA polymerase sigma-70 factor (ECF subfamily)